MHVLTLLQHLLVFTALLFAGTLYAAPAIAPAHAATEQVKVRLIAERLSVEPGSEVLIGLEQKIIPHWHTYWQNPGDSGLASSIEWILPAAASAGAIQWPVPERHKSGGLTNYGYADQVVLLSPLRIPTDAKPDSDFVIRAKASWLVCEEICIPQQAELGLTLKIARATEATAGAAPAPHPLIQTARSRLPQAAPWPATVAYAKDKLQLRITAAELNAQSAADIWFYPLQWGKLNHGGAQKLSRDGDNLLIDLQPGEAPGKAGDALEGVLVIKEKTKDATLTRGFTLRATATSAPLLETGTALVNTASAASISASTGDTTSPSLLAAILLAFAGGIVLNLMPCVFPVLSIKALTLVRHGPHASRTTRLHGLAYTAGIVLSFLLLAGLLLLLRSSGAQIGWGFQFQSPLFVLAIAWLMFAIGLSLSGVFTLGNSIAGLGEELTEQPGYSGSFFTGVLATVVATPCTAPFMGVAIAYALSQPALQLFAVFVGLGLGLALPYLLLSNWPLLQRCLPKPGVWMERLKQAFAFPMYATALWLSWVLVQQAGPDSLLFALGGMLLIALAAWLFDSTRALNNGPRRVATLIAIGLIASAAAVAWLRLPDTVAQAEKNTATQADSEFETYSEARLQALRSEGKAVFLNFTAAWCITCLVNERVALSHDSVQAAFKADGLHYLKGDWTNQDAAITRKLAEFGRNGVPLYVFYPAGKTTQAMVLPQILTPDIVLEHIRPATDRRH